MSCHVPRVLFDPAHGQPRRHHLRPIPPPPHPWDHDIGLLFGIWSLFMAYPWFSPSDTVEDPGIMWLELCILAEMHGIGCALPPEVHSPHAPSSLLWRILRRFRLAPRFIIDCYAPASDLAFLRPSTARSFRLRPLVIIPRSSALVGAPVVAR